MKIKLIKFLIFQSLILILLSCSSESENAVVPSPATNQFENINIISDWNCQQNYEIEIS